MRSKILLKIFLLTLSLNLIGQKNDFLSLKSFFEKHNIKQQKFKNIPREITDSIFVPFYDNGKYVIANYYGDIVGKTKFDQILIQKYCPFYWGKKDDKFYLYTYPEIQVLKKGFKSPIEICKYPGVYVSYWDSGNPYYNIEIDTSKSLNNTEISCKAYYYFSNLSRSLDTITYIKYKRQVKRRMDTSTKNIIENENRDEEIFLDSELADDSTPSYQNSNDKLHIYYNHPINFNGINIYQAVKGKNKGYIDDKQNWILNPEFSSVSILLERNSFIVERNDSIGIYNMDGTWEFELDTFSMRGVFHHYFEAIEIKQHRYRFIINERNEIIEESKPKYYNYSDFNWNTVPKEKRIENRPYFKYYHGPFIIAGYTLGTDNIIFDSDLNYIGYFKGQINALPEHVLLGNYKNENYKRVILPFIQITDENNKLYVRLTDGYIFKR